MSEDSAIARRQESGVVPGVSDTISPEQLIRQVALIQTVMKSVMKEGEHYGVIPGTQKPSLYKAGAEKLLLTFRFAPSYHVDVIDIPPQDGIPVNGHREYRVRCTLTHIPSGSVMGEGMGSACTLESKWRYRTGPVTLSDNPVPKEYWDCRKTDPAKAQQLLGGKGFVAKKNDSGTWVIATQGEKVENENISDVYNTVLKMSKIRSLRDAVMSATACSDLFTQDIEDLPGVEGYVDPAIGTPASHEPPPPASAPPEKVVSEGMVKLFHVLFDKIGMKTEDAKHKYAGSFLSKTVDHLSKLPMEDGRKLMDHLQEEAKKVVKQ